MVWLERFPEVAMFMFWLDESSLRKLDPGTILSGNVVKFPRGKLLIFTQERGLKIATQNAITSYNEVMHERYQSFQTDVWLRQVEKTISNILQKFIPGDLSAYFTPEALAIWARGLTHQSFAPEPSQNYEQLETLGDRALEYSFTRFLIEQRPDITDSQITQIKRSYMSGNENQRQQGYSIRLGFRELIRHLGPKETDAMLEDVFEAFVGALDQVSNLINPCLPMYNIMAFTRYMFTAVEPIDFSTAKEPAKSQVYELFTQMGWDRPGYQEEETLEGYRITINLSTKAQEKLKQSKMQRVPYILGVGTGRTKHLADQAAYEAALATLNRLGITKARHQEGKEKRLLQREDHAMYLPAVRRRLHEEGFVDFKLYNPSLSTGFESALVELFGVRPDKSLVLLRANIANTPGEGHLIVLREYAEGR